MDDRYHTLGQSYHVVGLRMIAKCLRDQGGQRAERQAAMLELCASRVVRGKIRPEDIAMMIRDYECVVFEIPTIEHLAFFDLKKVPVLKLGIYEWLKKYEKSFSEDRAMN